MNKDRLFVGVLHQFSAIRKTTVDDPTFLKAAQALKWCSLGFPDLLGVTDIDFLDLIPLPRTGEPNALLVIPTDLTMGGGKLETAKSYFTEIMGRFFHLHSLKESHLSDVTHDSIPRQPYWLYDVEINDAPMPIEWADSFEWDPYLGNGIPSKAHFRATSRRGLRLIEGLALMLQLALPISAPVLLAGSRCVGFIDKENPYIGIPGISRRASVETSIDFRVYPDHSLTVTGFLPSCEF